MKQDGAIIQSIRSNPTRWTIVVPVWVLSCVAGTTAYVWNHQTPKKEIMAKTKVSSHTDTHKSNICSLDEGEYYGVIEDDTPRTNHRTLEVTVTDRETGYSISGSRELKKGHSVYNILGIQKSNPCKSFMPLPGTVDQVIRFAVSKIGYPYVWAGKGLKTDQYDCSSFVQAAFSKANIILPRTAYQQSKIGKRVSINDLKEGDVLFFLTNKKRGLPVTHVAIYMGHNKMIHTNTKSKPLRIENFDKHSRYRKLFVVARRYI